MSVREDDVGCSWSLSGDGLLFRPFIYWRIEWAVVAFVNWSMVSDDGDGE